MKTAKELETVPETVVNPLHRLVSDEIQSFLEEWEAANLVVYNEDTNYYSYITN